MERMKSMDKIVGLINLIDIVNRYGINDALCVANSLAYAEEIKEEDFELMGELNQLLYFFDSEATTLPTDLGSI